PERAANAAPGHAELDPDDSWRIAKGLEESGRKCRLSPDCVMTWVSPNHIAANEPVSLRFGVHNAECKSVGLEPYLGMRGHLALRRDDGSVFTHLHPVGSASMAAMQLAVFRIEGKLPLKAAFGAEDPICQLPAATATEQAWIGGNADAEGVS